MDKSKNVKKGGQKPKIEKAQKPQKSKIHGQKPKMLNFMVKAKNVKTH